MYKKRTQHISKTLIRQHLLDSDVEHDLDLDTVHGDPLTLADLRSGSQARGAPRCLSPENLLSCKSWLDQLCDQEQVRIDEAAGYDSKWDSYKGPLSRGTERQDLQRKPATKQPSLDTSVLQRIREGRGPQDKVFEDLLTPLRDSKALDDRAETYDAMKRVLLMWNDRVTGGLGKNRDAREMLRIAVERRISLLKGSSQDLNRRQALEESSTELLQALTALRPEIADFKNQKHFEILIMMWANVQIAIPDLDDELKLLTMKALIDEVESKLHTSNARKLSRIARSLSVARLEQDEAAIERLQTKMQAFERKMRETAVRKLIDMIKVDRRELLQVKLKELQKLAELQAAQKWAAHDKLGDSQPWKSQSRACDQADCKLQRVLQQQVPDLNAHVHVVQSNANALAGMCASSISRAVEAGFSFRDEYLSTLLELAKTDVKTYLTGNMVDVFYAQEEAAKMQDRMSKVETHLDVLMDAAKNQYREYDGLWRLLDPAGSLGTSGDMDMELAEKYGPRRESTLLMIRDMRRAKLR